CSAVTPSLVFVLLLILRPPPSSTLFPYTTLFRSPGVGDRALDALHGVLDQHGVARGLDALEALGDLADRHQRLLLFRLRRGGERSEEHTSELQSRSDLVCRLLLEKKK